LVFIREFFQCLALGLGQEQGRGDTGEHEEGEDLEDVLDKRVGAADVLQACEPDLGKDRTELAGGGGDAVGGRAVAGRERLAGDDKRRGVWSCTLGKYPALSKMRRVVLCARDTGGYARRRREGRHVPKFWKKLARQYRKTKTFVVALVAMSLS
jgi:hypothetical protein